MAKHSPGFLVVEIVVVLVIIAAAGFGGWYVWQKHDKKATNTSKTSSASISSNAKQDVNNHTKDENYLVIKEWGIRIPLSSELRSDVAYGIYTHATGEQVVYFGSKALTQKAPGSYCTLKQVTDEEGSGVSGGTFALERSKSKPDSFNAQSFYDQATGYWYTPGVSNGGACYEGDNGEWRSTFNAPLSEAVKQLQSINN